MEDLGRVYGTGIGVAKDSTQAVRWYRRASDSGSLVAMLSLAGMYRDGEGVEKDESQAQLWTRKAAQAAEAGGAGTMYTLGSMYARPGPASAWKQDYVQAAEWYRKAAQAGSPFAMMSMGSAYENGRGVDRDDAQAVDWYRKAANAGNVQAMLVLGKMYRTGTGVEKDDTQALTWFRQATARGGAPAMYAVGRLYETTGAHPPGVGLSVDKDYQQAASWYGKAATLGYTPAMVALGSVYERGLGVDRDPAQAATWYRKAASAGDTNAAARLQALSASNRDSGSNPPRVPVAKRKYPGPNFAGTWFEINPKDSAKPRRLVLQQNGAQVTFAGFQLTINQGVATWTGPQSCAPQLQRSGYNYGSSGVAGTSTLKMSLEGTTLVYENNANWTAPCDGHPIGNERNISRFQRAEISETRISTEGGVATSPSSAKDSFLWVLDRSRHLRIADPSGGPMKEIAPLNLDLSVGGNRVLSASRDGHFAVAVNAYDAVDKLVRYDVGGSSPWSIKVGSYSAVAVADSGFTYAVKRGRERTKDVIQKIDSQTGKVEREKEIPQSAFDIVVDVSNENVWLAGRAITLLDLDLNERWTRLPSDFFYVSIDVAPDGSLLALERKYDQNRGQDRLLRVSINGDVLNNFPLDFMPARVVANRGFWDVWVVGAQVLRFSKELFGRNPSGEKPQRYDIGPATYADVARDGSVWIGARTGLMHLARDGRVLGQLQGLVTEKLCIAVVDTRN
jgi:TPR repeat protein